MSKNASELNERQQHLMQLLDAVELDEDVSLGDHSAEQNAKEDQACPGCGSVDPWETSSWCPKCGYYPKTGKSVFGDNVRETLEQLDEKPQAVNPLEEEKSGGGALFLLLGMMVFGGLGVGAMFLVPGLNPFSKKTASVASSADAGQDEMVAEESDDQTDSAAATEVAAETPADQSAQVVGSPKIATQEAIVADKSFQEKFLIFGYATNQEGEIRSIMLAAQHPNSEAHYYFAGKLSLSTRDPEFLAQLQELLDKNRTRRPALQSAYEARWTAPIVWCDVHHNGATPDGRIAEGQLISFDIPDGEEADVDP